MNNDEFPVKVGILVDLRGWSDCPAGRVAKVWQSVLEMPRKSAGRCGNELNVLIGRLEAMQEVLEPSKSQEPEEEGDPFSKLRKLAARQINEIRCCPSSGVPLA